MDPYQQLGDVDERVNEVLGGPVRKAMKQGRALRPSVISEVQHGALHHSDPQVRRWCLFILDHYANDESIPVFAEALQDEMPFVRDLALHSIACEPCKDSELCVADVVPHVVRVLECDPKPDLRIKAIASLLGLSGRDERARDAIRSAATRDPDPHVRKCAADALAGYFVAPKKRYERSQRRHASCHR